MIYLSSIEFPVDSSSLELERVAILYNIASIQTCLGGEYRGFNTDEGLKSAAKCYLVRKKRFIVIVIYCQPVICHNNLILVLFYI